MLRNKACGAGYLLGLKAAGIPETSELYKALPKYSKQKKSVAAPAAQAALVVPNPEVPTKDAEPIAFLTNPKYPS